MLPGKFRKDVGKVGPGDFCLYVQFPLTEIFSGRPRQMTVHFHSVDAGKAVKNQERGADRKACLARKPVPYNYKLLHIDAPSPIVILIDIKIKGREQ